MTSTNTDWEPAINDNLLSDFEANLLSHKISVDLDSPQLVRVNAFCLALKSEYFYQRYAELGEQFAEAGELESLWLTRDEICSPEALGILVYFCHFDCIRTMRISLLRHSLVAAEHFKCKKLEQYASEFAAAQLSLETANRIWLQVCDMPEMPVTETVRLFVLRHFLELAERADFRDYGTDLLEELLRDDRLNVWHEDLLVEPLLRWLCGRSTLLWDQMRLLSSIRFDALSWHSKAALADIEGFQFFEGFRQSPMFAGMCGNAEVPRRTHEGVLAVGNSEHEACNQVYFLDPRQGRVARLAPRFRLPEPRIEFACATLDDCRVFIAGGRKGRGRKKYTADCICLDLSVDSASWEPVPALNEARSSLSAVVCNSVLYVIGGRDSGGCLATVESLETSPVTGSVTWRLRAPLLEGRCNVGVTSIGNRIVACGGNRAFSGFECQIVDWYDPAADQWSRLASMAYPRAAPGLLELPGENPQLLVLGGNTSAGPERLQFFASGRWPRWVAAAPAPTMQLMQTLSCRADSRWLVVENFANLDDIVLSQAISIPIKKLRGDSEQQQELKPDYTNWLGEFAFTAMVTIGGLRTIDRLLEFAIWL